MEKQYFVYVLSNYKRTTLYVGVTSNLKRRLYEHAQGTATGFTNRYKLKYLMYYEIYSNVSSAIAREKSLKGKSRNKKNTLISSLNPLWKDLSDHLL